MWWGNEWLIWQSIIKSIIGAGLIDNEAINRHLIELAILEIIINIWLRILLNKLRLLDIPTATMPSRFNSIKRKMVTNNGWNEAIRATPATPATPIQRSRSANKSNQSRTQRDCENSPKWMTATLQSHHLASLKTRKSTTTAQQQQQQQHQFIYVFIIGWKRRMRRPPTPTDAHRRHF